MSGFRPNDEMRLPGLGVPVDPWSGQPIQPVITARLQRLKVADRDFRMVLHELDGTTEGSRSGDRRMALAFTKLEEVMLWASAALLNHGDT